MKKVQFGNTQMLFVMNAVGDSDCAASDGQQVVVYLYTALRMRMHLCSRVGYVCSGNLLIWTIPVPNGYLSTQNIIWVSWLERGCK